jgi:Holliday junction DNA helicase RuvA
MFNSLRGVITEKRSDALHLAVGGVEWDIAMPAIDLAGLPPAGSEARILTWLYHREDQMRLFGFADAVRRETFLELQKVEGIGPKAALKIMSGIDQASLERALETDDIGRLEAVPGLGKKTAQKMILTLKGRLARSDEPESGVPAAHRELVDALAGMGYDKKTAADAIARAEKEIAAAGGMPRDAADREKALFKRAIMLLSGA